MRRTWAWTVPSGPSCTIVISDLDLDQRLFGPSGASGASWTIVITNLNQRLFGPSGPSGPRTDLDQCGPRRTANPIRINADQIKDRGPHLDQCRLTKSQSRSKVRYDDGPRGSRWYRSFAELIQVQDPRSLLVRIGSNAVLVGPHWSKCDPRSLLVRIGLGPGPGPTPSIGTERWSSSRSGLAGTVFDNENRPSHVPTLKVPDDMRGFLK